jgi:hypothetical protein
VFAGSRARGRHALGVDLVIDSEVERAAIYFVDAGDDD